MKTMPRIAILFVSVFCTGTLFAQEPIKPAEMSEKVAHKEAEEHSRVQKGTRDQRAGNRPT